MDREQEDLQFLGFFGICKESINIIFRWYKIYTELTLTLIIPLSCIFIANDGLSAFISSKIFINTDTLKGTLTLNKIWSELTTFQLLKLAYLTFHLIFSLLSTSAVVYTIACDYIGKQISFKMIMRVVPWVWKRLFVTFLWNVGIMFVYNFVWSIMALSFAMIWFGLTYSNGFPYYVIVGYITFSILLTIYLLGFAYISVIWQLACVVSLLEDTYGIQAMMKSKDLIKGKKGIAIAMILVFTFCLLGINILLELPKGIGGKIGYGILCFVLLTWLFLFGLVDQTVIYFVCKSYHHEMIDKSSLADHLDAYLGEYIPLDSNLQLEQFHV